MRTSWRAVAVISTLGAGSLVAPAATATTPPGDVACKGTITGRTIRNVSVAPNTTCTLDRVIVTGSVTLSELATATLNHVIVRGNVTVGGPPAPDELPPKGTHLDVEQSVVGGLIQKTDTGSLIVNRSAAKNVIGGGAGLYGSDTTITNSAVAQNLRTYHGPGAVVSVKNVVVGQELQVAAFTASIDRATVRGAAVVDADSMRVCGSRFASLSTSSEYAITLGDGGACTGNTIRGDLSIGKAWFNGWFYNNTVRGRTTSPQDPPEDVRGTGNRFLGGVTGYVSRLT